MTCMTSLPTFGASTDFQELAQILIEPPAMIKEEQDEMQGENSTYKVSLGT